MAVQLTSNLFQNQGVVFSAGRYGLMEVKKSRPREEQARLAKQLKSTLAGPEACEEVILVRSFSSAPGSHHASCVPDGTPLSILWREKTAGCRR